ncbi:hypothetical protein U9M48_004021 [Paspalum notatum var. saurae]|uniref:Integrase catalytic domain-containing protein n=1 Tax=Paspalum notatum var. saurae TaxID=547442 RepID=A0AAQ3PM27_PASNO
MNPDTKIILDEIARRFDAHDAKWDQRARDQEAQWDAAFADFTRSLEDRIRQSSTIADYVEKFTAVVDQLISYNSANDPLYYVQSFINGLRPEIRAAVFMQRPSSLDSAYVLAMMREESVVRSSLLARPGVNTTSAEEPKKLDNDRVKAMDDKLAALRAFRRAKGTCRRCAEKWSKGHRCPTTVQLHALQEVWDLFQLSEESPSEVYEEEMASDQLFLTVSVAAVQGLESSRTMRFQGMLQGQAILILVDSGSSHTFLSSKVADKVVGVSPFPVPIAVQVADGGRLPCGTHIKQAHWQLDECNFFTDMKILDLSYYDLIVGMDWLKVHSPMEVHWLQKWMIISYQNASVLLQGLVPELPAGSVVEVAAITQEQPDLSVMGLHPELVQLLESYVDVFDKPTGLPPSRSCDHAIPLVPCASPVRIGPYRYPLQRKDEIETQGVATDPSKISAVANWPTPTSVKELRSFLGLAGYYRRFVRHFGVIARPLNDLLKKGALFVWTSQHDGAFQALKEALITAPVLALPNFSVPFCIETDASGVGVGAVLMQQEIIDSYTNDPHSSQLLAQLAVNSNDVHFTLVNGVIRYNGKIWIGNHLALHNKLINAFHSSAIGGHSGVHVTLARLKQLFAWRGMKSAVKSFVQLCQVCQQAKPDRSRSPGLLQPLPVPATVWEIISMDFIEGLPSSGHANCILVVVDLFTKYAHFIALHHPFTASSVARVFHDQVYKHHGLPQAIVSDRDRIFLSRLWQQLFQLADVQLRMMVAPSDLDSWWTERQLMTDVIRQHLERAKIRMKKQADKGHSEREFQVGDLVFLKLQPYVQSSLAPRANQKLAFKFFGPYQILSRVGSVAYKLQLPASAAIHPVFHVSQLKRAVGSGFTASPILPDPSFEWSIPLKILGRRTVTRGRDSVPQVLVQWSQMPESLATWEDTEALKQQFPRAAVWGHPASQDGGIGKKPNHLINFLLEKRFMEEGQTIMNLEDVAQIEFEDR